MRKFPNEAQGVGSKKFLFSVASAQGKSAVKKSDLTGIKVKHNSCVCTGALCSQVLYSPTVFGKCSFMI